MTFPLKIGFLGSGEIAVPVLDALMASPAITVAFVNTQPDRPSGRKNQLTPTPVGQYAAERGVPLFKENVNSDAFKNVLNDFQPETLLVIDFGQLLKSYVLNFPKLGCVNIHASILPKYRGASPIQSALVHNDLETGIGYMAMAAGLDTGDVYHTERLTITETMRAPELLHALGELAAHTVVDTLLKIADGTYTAIPQNHAVATHCGKIKREDGLLDWTLSASVLRGRCRGYHPWPGLWFVLDAPGKTVRLRLTQVALSDLPYTGGPGTLLAIDKKGVVVACGEGALCLERVVPEGRNEMSASDFVRGIGFCVGDVMKIKN